MAEELTELIKKAGWGYGGLELNVKPKGRITRLSFRPEGSWASAREEVAAALRAHLNLVHSLKEGEDYRIAGRGKRIDVRVESAKAGDAVIKAASEMQNEHRDAYFTRCLARELHDGGWRRTHGYRFGKSPWAIDVQGEQVPKDTLFHRLILKTVETGKGTPAENVLARLEEHFKGTRSQIKQENGGTVVIKAYDARSRAMVAHLARAIYELYLKQRPKTG